MQRALADLNYICAVSAIGTYQTLQTVTVNVRFTPKSGHKLSPCDVTRRTNMC